MPLKLTERTVAALDPPAKGATTVWDSDVTGFGIRVFAPTERNPKGARSFFLNYRHDGTERRFTIGAFGDWSAEAARIEAKQLRRQVNRGADPAAEKQARREAPTVKDLAERYRAEHLPNKAKSSQANDWNMIEKIILPVLGGRKVADVHQGDMSALHKAITAEGKATRANRVLAVASKMFSLSLIPAAGEAAPWRDQAQGNPCKGVGRNHEEGHERFLSTAEIAAVSEALDRYPRRSTADCVRLIMLTGCRPGEAMHATWEQFDAEPGFWVKPSSHTKQRKLHRVPLSPAALELIEGVRAKRGRSEGEAFVFPGQIHGARLQQLRDPWAAISSAASVALWAGSEDAAITGLVTDLAKGLGRLPTAPECLSAAKLKGVSLPPALTDARLYDLRHSFASIGAGGGLSLHIIGKLLGHTQGRTTQRYAHLADDPLREAAAKIASVITGAGRSSASVTPFPAGRRL
ncbi:MAG: tyrosine-type recombinase/integrase [Hyphomicrobiales bacterium]